MKRFGNLFPKIVALDNIREAFRNASKGKSHYRDVKNFKKDIGGNCRIIRQMLRQQTFKNADYTRFISTQYGKRREISKLPFYPDRIIQHALCQVLEPIWNRQYIRNTFSCIKGKGIHDGVKRVKKALQCDSDNTKYCLKLDVKKYFPSVDNDILKSIVRRKIKCKGTLWLLDEIIDSHPGLPIGNYTSQHLSNLYLSGLDHFIKETLKVKHYFRYCDDLVLLGKRKALLWDAFGAVKAYLNEKLNLRVKGNWQVFPVEARGIDFLGYRFFHGYTLLRKSIAAKFKRRMREIDDHADPSGSRAVQSTIASYLGWMKYANCYNLKQAYLGE